MVRQRTTTTRPHSDAPRCRCRSEINEAIAAHLDLVEAQCRRLNIHSGQRSWVDAYSDGQLALWKALTVFDASRYRSFEAFASERIRYAIIDGIPTREGTRPRPTSVALSDELLDGVDADTADRVAQRDLAQRGLDDLAALHPLLPELVLLRADGWSYRALARRFCVSTTWVFSILSLRSARKATEAA